MKRILSYLSIVLLSASVACSDSSEMDKAYNSVITPGFTFGEEEIIAGITPVTFTNTTTAEGTTVSEYFWHFGFAGEGNWSEEAAPDPIVYNRPGDYTVTLTAWGADGNRATTTRTITVLADNVLPTADFSYSPQMISIGTTVTFTDKSTDSDGEIVSREWLFPDGTTSTDINATYTFEQMGMFNVQLTVTDDRGGSNSTSKAINVRAGDVNAFTLLWSTAVASADALCAASVVAASDMGYIYSVSGDGKMVALNTDGAKVWEYDAMAKDGVYLKSEISYPSVDTDGTVYWVAHGYGGSSSASLVYAFDGATGSVLWKNTTAYAPAARIAFSTPCISPSMVIVGSRGTNGAIRGFEKGTGKNTATATPANGGGTSGTIALKNGVVIFTNTAQYGYGIMVPDASFVWSPVPTSDTSTAVASADALCAASVVAASDMGYIYSVSGDGKMVALNTDGAKVWEYDAMAKDGVYLKSEISYPSVDTDGTVYWVAHGYGGSSSASLVYAFDGATGSVLWKNTTAYAPAARIAFSTPCISPSMVIVGSRGTNGAIRGFEKGTGKNTATATPANGGGTSGTIALKNGVVIFTNTAQYGYGIMVPDASFVWSPVPTSDTFAPNKILSAGRCQPCVDADNCVYLPGIAEGSGTWNLASFDCTNLTASSKKTPKWSVNLPDGFQQTGASLSADGTTLYIVADKATPSVVYALNTSNGSTRWSYTLDAASNSIPAVDNLGQIHLCTKTGDYVVLSAEGELRYKEHLADSVDGSPTISEWGYSYFLGKDSAAGALKVYSVALPGVTSPAASAWSQYGQNARHSNYQK